MAVTRKLSKVEMAKLIDPATAGPTGTRKLAPFDRNAALVAQSRLALDRPTRPAFEPMAMDASESNRSADPISAIERIAAVAPMWATEPVSEPPHIDGGAPIDAPPHSAVERIVDVAPISAIESLARIVPPPPTTDDLAKGDATASSDHETEGAVTSEDRSTPAELPVPSCGEGTAISIPPAAIEVAPTHGSRVAATHDASRLAKTQVARRFSTLADDVNEHLADVHVGAGEWGVELCLPEGPLVGTEPPVQHLRMRPRVVGYPDLLAGVVHIDERTATLRHYTEVSLAHLARSGQHLEISEGEWERLLQCCEMALERARVSATRTPPSSEGYVPPSDPPRVLAVLAAALFVALTALVLVALLVLR